MCVKRRTLGFPQSYGYIFTCSHECVHVEMRRFKGLERLIINFPESREIVDSQISELGEGNGSMGREEEAERRLTQADTTLTVQPSLWRIQENIKKGTQ